MAKGGGGKALTGIICFILGFIIAIVAEVALIAGGVYWLLNTDLDSIFETLGVENEEETEDGTKYVYINTDADNGGVTTVLELVSALQDIAGKGSDELTIGDLTGLLPVADTLVDSVYSALASVLDMTDDEVRDLIDEDDLKSTPLAELTDFLLDSLYQLELAKVLEIAGIDVDGSAIYRAIAYGSAAGTIEIGGDTYVLYVEELEEVTSGGAQAASAALTSGGTSSTTYTITASGNALDSKYYDYVYTSGDSSVLYYYVINGTAYVAQRNSYSESTRYSQVTDSATGGNLEYAQYDSDTATYSGAYYYDGGELIILSSRTLDDFVSDGIDDLFYDLYITDLMSDEADSILLQALDGISLGALMSGEADTSDMLNDILITDLFDGADELMYRLFDGVTIGDITTGNVAVDDLMEQLYIPDVLDAEADSGIMAFIAYSVTDIIALDSGSYVTLQVTDSETLETTGVTCNYTATLHLYTEEEVTETNQQGEEVTTTTTTDNEYTAYLKVEDGVITGVWYYDGEGVLQEYSGVAVSEISKQMDYLMDTLTIGDITDLGDSSIADKLSGYTINEIGDFIDELTLADVMGDVDSEDSAIIMYLVYGISGVDFNTVYDSYSGLDEEGNTVTYYVFEAIYHDYAADSTTAGDTYDAYVVATYDGYVYTISEVYYHTDPMDETTKTDAVTLVNDISGRIDGLMNDLTIGEITDLGDSSLAKKLSGYTINQIDDFIDELTLADVMGDVDSEDSAVITYIVYGISGLDFTDTPSDETIDGVTYYTFEATYHDYEGNEYDAYVVATYGENESGSYVYTISEVYYYTDPTDETTKKDAVTLVNDISDRIDGLMNDLKIGEITDLGNTKLAAKLSDYTINEIDQFINELTLSDVIEEVTVGDESSAIMAYIVYGINNLTQVDETHYTATYNTYGTEDNTAADGATVYVTVDAAGVITGVYTDDTCTTAISGTPIDSVSARVTGLMNDLTIGELIEIKDSSSVILKAIKDSTINSLSGDIAELTIQELFYEDIYGEVAASAATDVYIGSYTVESYGYTVESYLKVVYESIPSSTGTYYHYTAAVEGGASASLTSILTSAGSFSTYLAAGTIYWYDGSTTIYNVVSYSSAYLYYAYDTDNVFGFVQYTTAQGHIGETSYSTYSNSSYYSSSVSSTNKLLYTYGEPSGAWYFMLYNSSVEVAYTIDDIGDLVQNATDNIQTSKLRKLVETGMISNADLVTYIDYKISISDSSYNNRTLGDLTLNETIDLFMTIIKSSLTQQTGS